MRAGFLVSAGALAALAGCSDDAATNPPKLWLALVGGNERVVQLVAEEPDPF